MREIAFNPLSQTLNLKTFNQAKAMIKKAIKKRKLRDSNLHLEDLAYWLQRSAEERLAAVEFLRRQQHGSSARLQRVARVIQQS